MGYKFKKTRVGAFLAAILLLALSFPALAEGDCPKSISPDNPRRTTTNLVFDVPLALKVLYDIKALNGVYAIPVGYDWDNIHTNSTPKDWEVSTKVDSRIVNNVDGFGITFWMPSLRYPEVDIAYYVSLRPCEDGRPPATPIQKEYIVEATVLPLEEMDSTPKEQYNKIIHAFGDGEVSYNYRKKHGLLHFELKKDPDRTNSKYVSIVDSEPQVLFECSGPEKLPSNPSCNGEIYFPSKKLYIHIRFPSSELPLWRQNIAATIKLFEKMRVKNRAEIEKILSENKVVPKE